MLENQEKINTLKNQELNEFFILTDHKEELKSSTACTILCTEKSTLLCLADKFADIVIENQEAGLILATAIGSSVILYVVFKSIAEVIIALRK
jgi:hypothetical protein